MKPTLTREQINALLVKIAARPSAVIPPGDQREVAPLDLGRSGLPSAAQGEAIAAMHEPFGGLASGALESLLRTAVEVQAAPADQTSYGQFLTDSPEPVYLSSISCRLPGSYAILKVDLSLALPMVDLILGGTGTEQTDIRDLTEIEAEIFESVIGILGETLQTVWARTLDMNFQIERRLLRNQATALMAPSEKLVIVHFEVKWAEVQGKITFAFPSPLSSALLRQLSIQPTTPEQATSHKNRLRLREKVLDGMFSAELTLPPSGVSVGELLKLVPGQVLLLKRRATDPINLSVEGKNMFMALPVRCGSQRGAQVQTVLSIIPEEEKRRSDS